MFFQMIDFVQQLMLQTSRKNTNKTNANDNNFIYAMLHILE
ncbi:hypothetical protein BC792_1375 [Sphingobacterium allocomposti]|uniref:Uncharacterized protein n=1 Tax=Sphingobacterium allocomposti TaxID=415956 RepID=A0A5S5CW64_9SPHI|nr:hypothetical protein BC792_1375 [Sphingobacterium composti Yoo et al. 2007 non Ten et al. 2007]